MANDKIVIHGAREHNLKDISLSIPKDKLVVITGLSGSGKSSLAFDTLYAEGRRRYVESLSSYARQFLGQMDKADVDSIDGLNPAIKKLPLIIPVQQLVRLLKLMTICVFFGHELVIQFVQMMVL